MAVRLPKGAKEYLNVAVTDNTSTITTLDGTTPKFDVKRVSTSTNIYTGQSAINSSMLVQCLVDTSLSGFVAGEEYSLYVFFTTGVEIPRLGPFSFYVVA